MFDDIDIFLILFLLCSFCHCPKRTKKASQINKSPYVFCYIFNVLLTKLIRFPQAGPYTHKLMLVYFIMFILSLRIYLFDDKKYDINLHLKVFCIYIPVDNEVRKYII